MNTRTTVITSVIAMLFTLTSHAAETLNVANWNDYIDESLLADFTKETGIEVNYKTYETNEEMYELLNSGGYDVIYPSLSEVPEMVRDGKLLAFDMTDIEGATDTQPILKARMRMRDPTGTYAAPYLWGRIGLLVNKPIVEAVLGRKIQPTWDLVFDPETAKTLSSCGVTILDQPDDLVGIYTQYKGQIIDSISQRKGDNFLDAVTSLLPAYQTIDSALYIESIPAGETCIAMSWEGDGRSAMAENPDHVFILPREGTVLFLDTVAISASTKKKAAAVKYIDFMLSKENAIRNAEYTGYNTPNASAQAAIIAKDPSLKVSLSEVTTFLTPAMVAEYKAEFLKKWSSIVSSKSDEHAKKAAQGEASKTASTPTAATNNKS